MPTKVERTVMERVRPVVTDTTDFYSFCQLNVTNLILFNTKSTNFTVFSQLLQHNSHSSNVTLINLSEAHRSVKAVFIYQACLFSCLLRQISNQPIKNEIKRWPRNPATFKQSIRKKGEMCCAFSTQFVCNEQLFELVLPSYQFSYDINKVQSRSKV